MSMITIPRWRCVVCETRSVDWDATYRKREAAGSVEGREQTKKEYKRQAGTRRGKSLRRVVNIFQIEDGAQGKHHQDAGHHRTAHRLNGLGPVCGRQENQSEGEQRCDR